MKVLGARWLWVSAGFCCVGLGAVGVILPLLPTTPLILLAAFCFSKSSPRWHQWLLNNPTFGPLLRDWHHHGIIRPKAKITATAAIVVLFSLILFLASFHIVIKWLLVIVAVCVLAFIWTRPSRETSNNLPKPNCVTDTASHKVKGL